jgi:hypothetical protein
MSVTFDFQIVSTDIPGMSLVIAQNEDAFSFVTDELDLNTLPDGSAPLSDSQMALRHSVTLTLSSSLQTLRMPIFVPLLCDLRPLSGALFSYVPLIQFLCLKI